MKGPEEKSVSPRLRADGFILEQVTPGHITVVATGRESPRGLAEALHRAVSTSSFLFEHFQALLSSFPDCHRQWGFPFLGQEN